ncbi:hypothetical protein BXP70_21090 [Hymenobacter crusticola]|uniref:Beta-lactamase class A catalytic domain-containing protein n=1 Tax=Hymenobacter crusticola TaxID=1770526 RepID=A0A243W8L9_9BACT|nr:hypothetical protein BXP70_21090 [Hymenobacter crusticola]
MLDSLLHSDTQLALVVRQAAQYELQIIYTQIDRDEKNQPHFTQHNFRLDARQYFDPASLVKLPTAALALEKLNKLRNYGVTRRCVMATGVAYRCQTPVAYVATADSDYQHSVGNYIKRMLLVSDNNAYNRLYEFLGQRPLNERLDSLGYSKVRIVRRFAPCDTAANRYTNPITFYDANGSILYKQSANRNPKPFDFPLGQITKGKAYRVGSKLIQQPYNFTTANYLPLQDITDMLKAVMFPASIAEANRFNLTSSDYQFLQYYLHSTPHSSGFEPYHSKAYFDAYKKYLYYGRRQQAISKPDLKIYNIVGMSHGYLADVAYITDSTQHTEFMLSCVLYVNKDGIINDGSYEYTTVGLPFLERLGKVVYDYEINRPKVYTTSQQN